MEEHRLLPLATPFSEALPTPTRNKLTALLASFRSPAMISSDLTTLKSEASTHKSSTLILGDKHFAGALRLKKGLLCFPACMRDLCKEEDYTFLNSLEKQDESPEESTCVKSECQEKQEERIHRQQEREQLEREKQREIEEQQKEKDKQWKSHVAELAVQRKAIRAKLDRLREFRDFQKKVVLQDLGLDPGSADESVKHLLLRL
ncbi:hypothetical protein QQF64_035008 [Cirrhinus molitorella]|uniref:Uncharacterized protein n=1 Tax=Cirrhinus molitorella TaxID=172907 RepID=A0ABR3NEJ4_9TELE